MAKALKTRIRPKAIELFCGAGGMSLGFEQAGFDIVLGVDVDGHHVAVHKRNFPKHASLRTSVVELTADRVFEAIGKRIEIDLVCGGPPCQGFSSMGLRDCQDPRNSLIAHFVRLVREIRPNFFVMENVPGMVTGHTKPFLDYVVENLQGVGYRIATPVRVLDASKFGVPQKRQRLFVLGAREDLGVVPFYPDAPHPSQPLLPTVLEAIGDLPDVENYEELFHRDQTRYDKEPLSIYAKVARGQLLDPSDYSYPRAWIESQCTGCLRIKHSEQAVAIYRFTRPGSTVPGHKLPRLHPDGICTTLRAGSDSTHGSHTAPRPIHPILPRCITAREAARLHGFPDWFSFFPAKWHSYRQIGNAVCPPVARAIGLALLDLMNVDPKKPDEFVALSDEFDLPEDRPRSLKRIPHVTNYPPVIAHLFTESLEAGGNSLKRSRFTFEDVRSAVVATGVSLPWIRADTFVQELARSRRVKILLASCLAKGYSIRALEDGEFIGEFVPEGEGGSITDKDVTEIKSRDLASATRLEGRLAADCLADVLNLPAAIRQIWDEKFDAKAIPCEKARVANVYRLASGSRSFGSFYLALAESGKLPTKARIKRLCEVAGTDDALVLARITNDHIAAIRFQDCLTSPFEIRRCVFQVEISDRVEWTLFGPVVLPSSKSQPRRSLK